MARALKLALLFWIGLAGGPACTLAPADPGAPAPTRGLAGREERGMRVTKSEDPHGKEQRLALVIGNSSYEDRPLRNPVNDADDMARALRELGFQVILEKNADQMRMEDAIRGFGKKLAKGGAGIFYYAGHGVQVEGQNYLIPIGARIVAEKDVKYKAVDLGQVLDEFAGAKNRVNILILDACRDNPFRGFRGGDRGLAETQAPSGTYVAYATGPGKVAADGSGRNGIFTGELLEALKLEGLTIEQVFKTVRVGVVETSGGRQMPWESSSLIGEFYFRWPKPDVAPAVSAAPPPLLPGDEKYNVKDLLDEAKKSWAARQGEMREVVEDARSYESQDLPPSLKAQVWQRFLDAYRTDNPHSDEDDAMRRHAAQRVAYWKTQKDDPKKREHFEVNDLLVAEQSRQLNERLTEMREGARRAESYETQDLRTSVKAQVWQLFLDAYPDDLPATRDDDALRDRARERVAYWKKQKDSPQVSSGSVSVADLVTGEAKRQQESQLQTLRKANAEAVGYEAQQDLVPSVKAQMWKIIADGGDIAGTQEDDAIRRRASERVAHWRALPDPKQSTPDFGAITLASAPADPAAAARAALESYRSAYEARNFERLREVWVMNPQQRTAMQTLFECADHIDVKIREVGLDPQSDMVSIDFDQTLEFSGPTCLMKTGKQASPMTATLIHRGGNRWVISSILPRMKR